MSIDPTTFAILRSSFVNIANEMGLTLGKVAYSPVITEGRDFAGAVYDSHGHLVACGEHDLTGLLGTMEPTIQLIFDWLGKENLREGDVVFVNCPHEAGSHLNDVRAVKPVYWEGEVVAFVADVGHWTDIGGPVPGSINPMARDSYGEGLRITPIKVVDGGVIRDDVIRMILGNLRIPYETNGDIFAQIKALDSGEARMHELLQIYGAATLHDAFAQMKDHAAGIFRNYLAQIPDREVEFSDCIDLDPLDLEAGPVHIHLKLIKSGDRLIFDFTGSAPAPKGGVGASRPLTCSGVYVPVLNLFPDVPFNHGFIECCEVKTKPGTAVHVEFPSPVSGAASGGFEKVIACTLGALGQLVPEKQVGSTYNLINVTLGGIDPRFNKPYVMYMWNEGGFGGGPNMDGGDAPTMALFSTGSRNQPVEVHERFYPVVYTELVIGQDTSGDGRWRGCPGIRHSYRLEHGEGEVGVFGDRAKHAPWGVNGGHAAAPQVVYVNRDTPSERVLGMFSSGVVVAEGDVVEVWSAGGGGFGDPLDREPERVLADVQGGILSVARAEEVYGVIVRCVNEMLELYEVDERATSETRKALDRSVAAV
ncbi:MAG: hydantoinase B/oxoprolinase family protein [Thermomicrobiales bacterium]|jgi:N-methylhydantoinase B|nr:hydantoinase B/oxoprolinase family protein [Thermomicrobiales bacterium]